MKLMEVKVKTDQWPGCMMFHGFVPPRRWGPVFVCRFGLFRFLDAFDPPYLTAEKHKRLKLWIVVHDRPAKDRMKAIISWWKGDLYEKPYPVIQCLEGAAVDALFYPTFTHEPLDPILEAIAPSPKSKTVYLEVWYQPVGRRPEF